MKLYVFYVVFILISLRVIGQERYLEKTYLVGGNVNFFASKNSIRVQINPLLGYFPINKLAIGFNMPFLIARTNPNTPTPQNYYVIGTGPFIRYYFVGKKNIDLFCGGNVDFFKGKTTNRSIGTPTYYVYSNSNLISLNVGLVCFLNQRLALENSIGYGLYHDKVITPLAPHPLKTSYNTLQYKMGLQIYLHKKEKKE